MVGVLVAILYVASAIFYNRSLPVDLGSVTVKAPADGLGVYVAMADIQSSKDCISAEILLTFGEQLTECTPVCGLSKDLILLVSPSTRSKIDLPRGTPAGFTIPVELFLEGAPYTYPFVSYSSHVFVQAISTSPGGSATAVPLVTELLVPEGFTGWRIQLGYPSVDSSVDAAAFLQSQNEGTVMADAAPSPSAMTNGQTWAYMTMKRSLSTEIIALLLLILMIILAALAVVASHDVQVGGNRNHDRPCDLRDLLAEAGSRGGCGEGELRVVSAPGGPAMR